MARYFKITEISPKSFKAATGESLGYYTQLVSIQEDACYVAVSDDSEYIQVEMEAMDYEGV